LGQGVAAIADANPEAEFVEKRGNLTLICEGHVRWRCRPLNR